MCFGFIGSYLMSLTYLRDFVNELLKDNKFGILVLNFASCDNFFTNLEFHNINMGII
jgi:hypothetical protein